MTLQADDDEDDALHFRGREWDRIGRQTASEKRLPKGTIANVLGWVASEIERPTIRDFIAEFENQFPHVKEHYNKIHNHTSNTREKITRNGEMRKVRLWMAIPRARAQAYYVTIHDATAEEKSLFRAMLQKNVDDATEKLAEFDAFLEWDND